LPAEAYDCINFSYLQAKELVEKAPVVVKTGLKSEEAEEIKKILVEAGAEVEID
jgi:large subunit ribosomal protein L7/L12